jgi:hypothetical protein
MMEACRDIILQAIPCLGDGLIYELLKPRDLVPESIDSAMDSPASCLKLILGFLWLLASRTCRMRAPRSSIEKNLDVNLWKEWWIVGGLGPNKIFAVKTTHKHREADKSARLNNTR